MSVQTTGTNAAYAAKMINGWLLAIEYMSRWKIISTSFSWLVGVEFSRKIQKKRKHGQGSEVEETAGDIDCLVRLDKAIWLGELFPNRGFDTLEGEEEDVGIIDTSHNPTVYRPDITIMKKRRYSSRSYLCEFKSSCSDGDMKLKIMKFIRFYHSLLSGKLSLTSHLGDEDSKLIQSAVEDPDLILLFIFNNDDNTALSNCFRVCLNEYLTNMNEQQGNQNHGNSSSSSSSSSSKSRQVTIPSEELFILGRKVVLIHVEHADIVFWKKMMDCQRLLDSNNRASTGGDMENKEKNQDKEDKDQDDEEEDQDDEEMGNDDRCGHGGGGTGGSAGGGMGGGVEVVKDMVIEDIGMEEVGIEEVEEVGLV